jgi:hypothetical protein
MRIYHFPMHREASQAAMMHIGRAFGLNCNALRVFKIPCSVVVGFWFQGYLRLAGVHTVLPLASTLNTPSARRDSRSVAKLCRHEDIYLCRYLCDNVF